MNGVSRGASGVTARADRPVAELWPVPRPLKAEMLLARWRRLPYVNYQMMRKEIDEILIPLFD